MVISKTRIFYIIIVVAGVATLIIGGHIISSGILGTTAIIAMFKSSDLLKPLWEKILGDITLNDSRVVAENSNKIEKQNFEIEQLIKSNLQLQGLIERIQDELSRQRKSDSEIIEQYKQLELEFDKKQQDIAALEEFKESAKQEIRTTRERLEETSQRVLSWTGLLKSTGVGNYIEMLERIDKEIQLIKTSKENEMPDFMIEITRIKERLEFIEDSILKGKK